MNEDMILPDDFQPEETATPSAEIETIEQQPEVTEVTPTEEPKQEQTETPKVKLKYNHEEKEYSLDEVIPLAQKGMNYDKVQEQLNQLKNDPERQFMQDLAKEYGFISIKEYIEAVKQAKEQEQLNDLIQKNIPEEYAKEMLENRKFRERLQQEEKSKAEKARQEADYLEFLNTFPNVKPEQITAETWEKVHQGTPLKYAYMDQQFAEMQNQISILKQNKANEEKAPINGVTNHGSQEVAVEDDFLKGFNSI